MNNQPVSYKQTDSRWGKEPYRVSGESSTIQSAGCGPSCAAMVIATLKDKTVTPKVCCDWSMAHGYKALRQGTYYSYFVPQFAAYGIQCRQLAKGAYDEAMSLLKEGYYIIALMGKGTWTSSGHFVLVWWADSKVRINDPASYLDARLNGDIDTFKAEAKYFWAVDAREYNKSVKTIPAIDAEEIKKSFTLTLPQLKQGDSGTGVQALQAMLNSRGFNCGTADGVFGAKTTSALKNFQAHYKLGADGIAGSATFKNLLGIK